MYRKIIYLFATFIFIFTPYKIMAEGSPEDEPLYNDMMDVVNVEEIEEYWKHIQQNYDWFIPELTSRNIFELMKSNEQFSFQSGFKGIMIYFLFEIIENGKLLGTLIILTLFSMILQTVIKAFDESSISKIANLVIFIVLIYFALQSFYLSYTYAKDAMETMSGFIIALMPLMLAIIASLGQLMSVAFFHPLILFLIHFSSLLLSNFVLPLLYLAALLMIVSQLNENFKLNHLATLFRSISLGILGVYVTAFLTVMSIQGTVTSIQDGVALKTAKFFAGNFIPVIGKALTDATDTILGSALLLKNAIGVIGLIIVTMLAIFPAIKIAALAFIYKLVSSLLQPLGSDPIIQTMSIISQYMMYILACFIVMTLMFFLTIVILIVASNLPLLLR